MATIERGYRNDEAGVVKLLIALVSAGVACTLVLAFVLGNRPAPAEPRVPPAVMPAAGAARGLPVEVSLDKIVVLGLRERTAGTPSGLTASSIAVIAQ